MDILAASRFSNALLFYLNNIQTLDVIPELKGTYNWFPLFVKKYIFLNRFFKNSFKKQKFTYISAFNFMGLSAKRNNYFFL